MVFTRLGGHRAAIALAIAAALALPAGAQAEPQAKTKAKTATREQQLESRVSQLEQELAELKDMLRQQQTTQQQQQQQVVQAQQQAAEANATAQKVAAAPPPKESFSTAPGVSVALHGFISASAFSQNRNFSFGNGQNAEYPIPKTAAAPSSGSLSGVDIRNTRFWLDFKGAKFTDNWSGGGRIEMDFFGGFNGTGPYSEQQPVPRLRQAYMDLTNPDIGSTVRIGQQWELLFPLDMVSTSLSHIAFPLGFGTGLIGWRFPGVVWMQELNHSSTSGPKWRLDLGAFEGTWNGPGDNINYLTAGNAGFRPQLEARLHVQDKDWLAFFVAHYSQVNLKGVGDTVAAPPIKDKIDSLVWELGGNWRPGPWNLKALVYAGKGIGQVFGDLSQFGDIKDRGGYLQVGYNFTKNWSVNAFYAQSNPDDKDVIRWAGKAPFANARLRNRQTALSLQYAAGAYELGAEWIYDKLDYTTNGLDRKKLNGNQVSLNALYKF